MTRMTIVVTVTFLVTQLPYHVSQLMNATKSQQLHDTAETIARLQMLGQIGSAANSSAVNLANRSTGVFEPGEIDNDIDSVENDSPKVTGEVVTLSPGTSVEMALYVWVGTVATMLQFVSSCLNPVIYGLMNRNYREYRNSCHFYLRKISAPIIY